MFIFLFEIFPRKKYKLTVKKLIEKNRTKTDTGRQVEKTKALEIIMLKELGKKAL